MPLDNFLLSLESDRKEIKECIRYGTDTIRVDTLSGKAPNTVAMGPAPKTTQIHLISKMIFYTFLYNIGHQIYIYTYIVRNMSLIAPIIYVI